MSQKDIKNKSDEELIVHYQRTCDNQWLGLLLERHTLLLLGVALKYLKDKEQAHDAVQQVFVKTLSNFPKETIQNFKGWLYILMRNHCLGLLRNASYFLPSEALEHIADTEAKTRAEHISDEKMLQEMHQAIDSLNAEQQICIRLFYIQELSYKEIMEQTNFSFVQVKSYVQNGKRNLKIALQNKNNKYP